MCLRCVDLGRGTEYGLVSVDCVRGWRFEAGVVFRLVLLLFRSSSDGVHMPSRTISISNAKTV